MNAEEIRKKFLEDNAEFLLDEYKRVLRGTGKFSCESGIQLGRALDILDKAIIKASDTFLVEAGNAKEIIELVKKGRATMEQATAFLQLLKLQQDIDDLPKLLSELQLLTKRDE